MRIGIDARLLTYRRGMGNFVYNLVQQWSAMTREHEFVLYSDTPEITACVPKLPNVQIRILKPAFYPVWEQLLLPLSAKHDKCNALYCPANTAPCILHKTIKLVMTIHDVMYLLPAQILPNSPLFYQRLGRLYRSWVVPKSAQRAQIVVTDSHYSRQDICTYIKPTPQRIEVVYGAISDVFASKSDNEIESVCKKYKLGSNYVFALGAIDPRKNTTRVIVAFAQAKSKLPAPTQLVISGLNARAQAHFADVCRQFALTPGRDVVLCGFVPENDLAALYAGARCVLYPSLYEGFGLPVLEAMACGAPVIASNTTSIPEIAGDAAKLIDPTNTTAIANAVVVVLNDEVLRQHFIERGKAQVKHYSWSRAAKEMLTLMTNIVAL